MQQPIDLATGRRSGAHNAHPRPSRSSITTAWRSETGDTPKLDSLICRGNLIGLTPRAIFSVQSGSAVFPRRLPTYRFKMRLLRDEEQAAHATVRYRMMPCRGSAARSREKATRTSSARLRRSSTTSATVRMKRRAGSQGRRCLWTSTTMPAIAAADAEFRQVATMWPHNPIGRYGRQVLLRVGVPRARRMDNTVPDAPPTKPPRSPTWPAPSIDTRPDCMGRMF